MKDVSLYLQGSAALTWPAWSVLLSTGWNYTIAVLGGVVLIMTAWNKILENKQRRRDLAANPKD
jgi:hypothetical protein